jgi:hypothetical protein
MTDPRNSMKANIAANDAWMAMPDTDDDEPMKVDAGPPWIVAGQCPYCLAYMDQKWASAQPEPRCVTCGQPLPAFPLVTSQLRRDALS